MGETVLVSTSFRIKRDALSGALGSTATKVVRLRPQAGWKLSLQPTSGSEPIWKTFECLYKYSDGPVNGDTGVRCSDLVITASRLLMLVHKYYDKEHQEYFVVVAAKRSDFPTLRPDKDWRGNIKRIDVRSADESASIIITKVCKEGDFPTLLEWLDSKSVSRLGESAAAQSAEAARQTKLARLEVAKGRFQGAAGQASSRLSSVISTGGIFDHRKTFYYRVAATPDACVSAFARAFGSGRGGLLLRAGWTLQRLSEGAVANYEGRKGLGAIGPPFHRPSPQSKTELSIPKYSSRSTRRTDNTPTVRCG